MIRTFSPNRQQKLQGEDLVSISLLFIYVLVAIAATMAIRRGLMNNLGIAACYGALAICLLLGGLFPAISSYMWSAGVLILWAVMILPTIQIVRTKGWKKATNNFLVMGVFAIAAGYILVNK